MSEPAQSLERFRALVNRPDEAVNLAEAALAIAQQEYPDLDPRRYLDLLGAMALEISGALRHFGAAVAQRQALTFDLARRAQLATVMLVVCRYATRQQDPLLRQAGICAALDLGARLTNSHPPPQLYQLVTDLGRAVSEDRFASVHDAERGAVLMADSTVA